MTFGAETDAATRKTPVRMGLQEKARPQSECEQKLKKRVRVEGMLWRCREENLIES